MAVVIAAFLFAIDILSDGRITWFYWPTLGLGLWVALSAIRALDERR
jgi:hypothetical protein